MSRLTEPSAKIDPLQRSRIRAVAADPSHPIFSGLAAVAPRLLTAMAFAGLVQMTFNFISR
ncbi:hypothetical protein [Rhizobium binae]|uniref:MFS transporter n=1 Tax=Rhizobium binae TaxID=1138190 RepID=A0ABV2MTX9_9HYPH|nr:hypothetical protein [Rhizobium binae]NKL51876.1 hypothetical protein [Rhizobium leguminosarum bv. viciae]MBX4928614.1 hypothetical protein [Rhizobium binae]MBX4936954.1 hypothetical protein [Rhizobium binae]MBX4943279.1 hypothetical protein [Rhizobium binae]MBX4963944.1 hypothetical protein [Rhizobium binae]